MNALEGIRKDIVDLTPTPIRTVAEWGRGIPGVAPLWFGESDQPTSDIIIKGAVDAMSRGVTRYQPNQGYPELLTALSDYLTARYTKVSEDRLMVTASGMSALMICSQAVIKPGGEIVTIGPQWPNLSAIAEIQGAKVTLVDLENVQGEWHLDLELFLSKITPEVSAAIINSPANPTGWVASTAELSTILEKCRETGTWLISDEVYSRLYYGGERAPSLLDVCTPEDRTLVVGSFSKAWTMTGWRLGWVVAPAEVIPQFCKLNEYNIAGPTAFVQAAGVVALNNDQLVVRLKKHCSENRELVQESLNIMPNITAPIGGGAFYSFFKIDETIDSLAFARELLLEAKVGLAPGIAFGKNWNQWMRLCFAGQKETISSALERFSQHMAKRPA